MNNFGVSLLEDLPVEILMEIFQYLSVHELYRSFSYLNIRLNSIIKSLPNLILITTSHWDPVLSFFHSFGAVQIHFEYPTSSSLFQYNFSHFIGIRSFIISSNNLYTFNYCQPIEQIDTFICPNLCPQLRSLRISYYSQKLIDWIFTGAFPHLKICHLYNRQHTMITLSSATNNTLQNLRQLTIHRRETREFEQILLKCPNLTYFEFFCHSLLPPFVHLNSPCLSLKRLRLSGLKDFSFHNGQFDSLLSFFPNLRTFYLMVDHCRSEKIDLDKMAHCLCQRLPYLTVLEMRILVTSSRSYSLLSRRRFAKIAQMYPLFKCSGRINEVVHIASFDIPLIYRFHHFYVRPSTD